MSWFGEKIRDPKTGLFRHKGDNGRTELFGPLKFRTELKRDCSRTAISRCNHMCPLCRGSQPGCLKTGRTQKKLRIYEESVSRATIKLIHLNNINISDIKFFCTLASLYYLRTFTFRFGNPSKVFFSLYKQSLSVVRRPTYPAQSIAFKNKLDTEPFMTWKREGRYVVLSKKQEKKLLCIGGISKILAARFFINHSFYSQYMFRRFFGQNSIWRLIRAGEFGILQEYKNMPKYCSNSHFGE
jgi:hypothetical protein